MRIVTWNVNSIRARIDLVTSWIDRFDPDVLLLQETRCTQAEFPMFDFIERGYEVAHHGNHHRNGVAIASRVGLDDVFCGFRWPPPDEPLFDEARLVSATCGGVRMHSVYVPNGREIGHEQYHFKLAWLDKLKWEIAADLRDDTPTLIGGDFNVAPADLDIYDPVRWRNQTHASPLERAAIQALVDEGLEDITRRFHPEAKYFTWWNYRPGQYERNHGLRIDLFLVSEEVANRTIDVDVSHAGRCDVKPSDHAPVVLAMT